jgi:hypothetical protein
MTERQWLTRLRWRHRGAWQWPAFAVAVAADALVLHLLPIAGDHTGLVGAVLLAGFFNLAVVAVLAPVAGLLLRRRRPELPGFVATDTAGTVLIGGLFAALLAMGLAHRPAVKAAQDDYRAQAAAVRRYVGARGPVRYRAGLGNLDTWKQATDLYRTCVPGPDPRRSLCFFVRTDRSPPAISPDPDQNPNSVLAGPDNPGRIAP